MTARSPPTHHRLIMAVEARMRRARRERGGRERGREREKGERRGREGGEKGGEKGEKG